jgi:hypothetical protein
MSAHASACHLGFDEGLIAWGLDASVVPALSGLDGAWDSVLRVVVTVALSSWDVDEVVPGVNPWRHLLGAVVFISLCGVAASLTAVLVGPTAPGASGCRSVTRSFV